MPPQSAPKKAAPKSRRPAPILVINRHNLFGWLVVGIVGCGLMFAAGVMVGRDTMPVRFDMERLDRKLANLKQSVLSSTVEPIDVIENMKTDSLPAVQAGKPHTLAPKYAKSDIEETPVSPPALEPEAKQAEARAPAGKASGKETGDGGAPEPKADAADQPTPIKKAAAEKPEPAEDLPEAAAALRGKTKYGFAIQVASLKNAESAGKVRDRFLAKGYPAYCRRARINGSIYHRVRIGPYPSRENAQKDRESLADAGVDAILVVVDSAR
jgi:cell division septation protein DedD